MSVWSLSEDIKDLIRYEYNAQWKFPSEGGIRKVLTEAWDYRHDNRVQKKLNDEKIYWE